MAYQSEIIELKHIQFNFAINLIHKRIFAAHELMLLFTLGISSTYDRIHKILINLLVYLPLALSRLLRAGLVDRYLVSDA